MNAQPGTQAKRGQRQQRQNRQQMASEADPAKPKQDQRIDQIELPLDRERPGMEKEFQRGFLIEIARFAPEHHIGEKGDRRGPVLAGGKQVLRQEPEGSRDEDTDDHGRQRGKDPARAIKIEIGGAKHTAIQTRDDDPRHQIARDDEEDINPGKSTAKPGKSEMESQNRQYGNCPQPVDILPKVHQDFPLPGKFA